MLVLILGRSGTRYKIYGLFVDETGEKKNVIKITYHDESEKRPTRTGKMLTRALTKKFLDELGLGKYSIKQPGKATELTSLRDLLVRVKLAESYFMK